MNVIRRAAFRTKHNFPCRVIDRTVTESEQRELVVVILEAVCDGDAPTLEQHIYYQKPSVIVASNLFGRVLVSPASMKRRKSSNSNSNSSNSNHITTLRLHETTMMIKDQHEHIYDPNNKEDDDTTNQVDDGDSASATDDKNPPNAIPSDETEDSQFSDSDQDTLTDGAGFVQKNAATTESLATSVWAFRLNYLLVILVIMLADGLQGTF